MKKWIVIFIVCITATSCASDQKAIEINEPETRIYKSFDEKSQDLYVGESEELTENRLKDFYLKKSDYIIPEDNLRKSIQVDRGNEVIISFDPVVDSVVLNNSYIVIIRDDYIKAISSNPTKFEIPESFDLEKIISLEEQELLNNKILDKMSKKGHASIETTRLYFDTQTIGKLIYTIKAEVETDEYVFAEVFTYDAYTGKLID